MTALRIAIALALLLVVALGVGIAVLPRLVAWDDYREELTERAEALTGQTVAIQGRIDLELLPRPTLTLARTTLTNPAAPAERALRVDRLDLRLKPLALLGGRLEVDELRLVRPVLQLGAAEDATGAALALAGGGIALPLAADGPSRLSVVDGRAVLEGTAEAPQHALEAINLDLAAAGPDGPYTLRGDFMIASQPFEVSARLGQIAADSWSTLQLELSAQAGESPARLSFHGLTWSGAQAPRLRGELLLAGNDARAGLLLLDQQLRLPAWAAQPFRLAGHLEFAGREGELDDLRLELADIAATGSLRLALAATPAVDLQLDLPRLAAPAVWLPDGDSLRALAALADDLAGRIDLSIGELALRGDQIRRLRATLALDGQGAMQVEQARATLPGQTTLTFTGALVEEAAEPALAGDLAVVVNDLPMALAWLDLAPSELPPGRLRTSTLASRVALSDGTLRFSDAELRVDASRLTGSLAVSLGARTQLAGALALDRLNLDAYWPDGEVRELAERTLALFGSLDAALEATIERLTWHGVRLQDLVLDGRSVAGRLTLNQLSLQDQAGNAARLTGEFDLEQQSFDLAGELHSTRPAQLLRGLAIEPPLMLARLSPVEAAATLRGELENAALTIELRHDDARLALDGTLRFVDGQPSYDLAVAAGHPDYPQLLDLLGIARSSPAEHSAAFELTGRLHGDLGEQVLVGSAQLGAMSLTGEVGWQRGPPRPELMLRLSVGEPSAAALADLAALAGLRLDPVLIARPLAGAWPSQPLALAWLGGFDAEVELSGKGGVVGPGFELQARLEQGKLLVDKLAASLWQGRLEAQASFDVWRPLPFMALAIDLRGVDPSALAEWLDLPPVVQGAADLYAEATAAGDNPRDLIGSLIGEVRVGLHDGRLVGEALAELRPVAALAGLDPQGSIDGAAVPAEDSAPTLSVSRLAGSFALKRGIATIEALPFELEGVPASLDGTIDLLLWAADLELRLERIDPRTNGVLGLDLIGPLAHPQVRLVTPEPGL